MANENQNKIEIGRIYVKILEYAQGMRTVEFTFESFTFLCFARGI